jgi:hypothetical protein
VEKQTFSTLQFGPVSGSVLTHAVRGLEYHAAFGLGQSPTYGPDCISPSQSTWPEREWYSSPRNFELVLTKERRNKTTSKTPSNIYCKKCLLLFFKFRSECKFHQMLFVFVLRDYIIFFFWKLIWWVILIDVLMLKFSIIPGINLVGHGVIIKCIDRFHLLVFCSGFLL